MITLFLPQENKERTKLWPILTRDSKGQVATPKFHSGEAVGDHLNLYAAAAAAKLLQPCPTLWDPIDGSLPGSPVPGILQARTQEWVAISFSNAWKWKVKVKSLSRVRLLATPWTAAHQAPPSMWFSRQEFWSGVPLPSPNRYAAAAAAAAANSLQSCPTLCDPIDGRPPGSPVPGILQARALEWVSIAFSIIIT